MNRKGYREEGEKGGKGKQRNGRWTERGKGGRGRTTVEGYGVMGREKVENRKRKRVNRERRKGENADRGKGTNRRLFDEKKYRYEVIGALFSHLYSDPVYYLPDLIFNYQNHLSAC